MSKLTLFSFPLHILSIIWKMYFEINMLRNIRDKNIINQYYVINDSKSNYIPNTYVCWNILIPTNITSFSSYYNK